MINLAGELVCRWFAGFGDDDCGSGGSSGDDGAGGSSDDGTGGIYTDDSY